MTELRDFFGRQFGSLPTHSVRAPGRVELLGNHTDYNQGLVMALAVDKFIEVAVGPRPDREVEIRDTAFPERVRFTLDAIAKDPGVPWADYPKGILLQLQQRGVEFGGFNLAIRSSIPLGAGLSSSAAFLVATALAVRKLYPFTLTASGVGTPPLRDAEGNVAAPGDAERLLLAKACQAAENQFVGVNCGILDHISSLFGRARQVIEIDCEKLAISWSPLDGNLAVVVCHSGVKHALVGGEYNVRRRHCESAARALEVPALRYATLENLEAARSRLDRRDYECALHVVGEIERVRAGAALLRAGQLEDFGRLLFASHESSRTHFLNSCPELDLLVELARTHAACLGARLTGGGFGGATVNLVARDQAEAFREHVVAGFQQRTGRSIHSWVCGVVDGAE